MFVCSTACVFALAFRRDVLVGQDCILIKEPSKAHDGKSSKTAPINGEITPYLSQRCHKPIASKFQVSRRGSPR